MEAGRQLLGYEKALDGSIEGLESLKAFCAGQIFKRGRSRLLKCSCRQVSMLCREVTSSSSLEMRCVTSCMGGSFYSWRVEKLVRVHLFFEPGTSS